MRKLLVLTLLFVSLIASASAEDEVSPEVLEQFERLAQQAMKDAQVPGMAISIVQGDKVVYLKGFGIRSLEKPVPVDPDTVFQIASCSKPVTSTALAALVGDGLFDWDTTIRTIDPSFRMADPYVTEHLTFRDLLSHRSGLPAFSGDLLEQIGYDRTEVLSKLHMLPLGSRFRSHYAYTNHGMGQAGVTGAKAAGLSFEDLLDKRVFGPLGMTSSSGRFEDFKRATNRADSYRLSSGAPTRGFMRQPNAQAPAGGVSSTARDMTKFLICHLNEGKLDGRQVIEAKALQTTHQPVMVTGVNPATFSKAGFYGLSWGQEFDRRGKLLVKHSGAFETGIRSQILLIPEDNIGIVILANAFPTGLPEGLSGAFFDLYYDGKTEPSRLAQIDKAFKQAMAALIGSGIDLDKRPRDPAPASSEKAYLGEYANDYFGPARVLVSGQSLVLKLGPDMKISAPLKHWERDIFSYQIQSPTMGLEETFVRFVLGPDGEADEMIVDALNDQELGRFKRQRQNL